MLLTLVSDPPALPVRQAGGRQVPPHPRSDWLSQILASQAGTALAMGVHHIKIDVFVKMHKTWEWDPRAHPDPSLAAQIVSS